MTTEIRAGAASSLSDSSIYTGRAFSGGGKKGEGSGYDILLGAFGTSLIAGFTPTCVVRNRTQIMGEPQVPGRSKTQAFMHQLMFCL